MRYRAFISYTSVDRASGERVHRAIEHYRMPGPLRGTDRGHGPVPKYLTPLFRDRSDANAGGNLGATLRAALESSDALVPLCSPAAAQSRWVNEEIRTFKALGRSARIFPVILYGTPRRYDPVHAPDGAFPPALFERVDASGAVVASNDPEPLAADVRTEGDGFDLATLKIVAGLTGIPLTELTQRQLEAERRERTVFRTVAGAMAALAAAAVVAAIVAYYSADAARTRLSNAIEMAARRVDDGARFADVYGVPTEVVRELLTGAERDFATLIGREDTGVPMVELQRARLLLLFSRFHGTIGDGPQQLTRAREGLAALERVPVARGLRRPRTWFATLPDPADVTAEQLAALDALGAALAATGDDDAVLATLEEGRDRAMRAGRYEYLARFWSRTGEHYYLAGQVEEARRAQDAAIAALDSYLTKDAREASATTRAERMTALSERAQLLLESERHEEALADQATVVAMAEARTAEAPGDANALHGLGQAVVRHADTQYAVSGSWAGAVPGFERALELFERLHARDPTRVDYARDLSIVLERLGDVLLQAGNVAGARLRFDRLLGIRRAQLARDPGSADARRDLAVALERQGDLALGERRPERALAHFDEALALRGAAGEEATPEDGDPVLVRDRAVLWYKLAAAREASRTVSWPDAYARAVALMHPLIDDGRAPPGWLRDVAVFRAGYGDALARAGRLAAARVEWLAALALVKAQLEIRPDDPRLQGDRRELTARLARPSPRQEKAGS